MGVMEQLASPTDETGYHFNVMRRAIDLIDGADETLTLDGGRGEVAERIVKEIAARLGFLDDVGLSYLTLDRRAETLSGGEAQRIRLASQIGSGLVGVMYILDEPSIGLHQRETSVCSARCAICVISATR